MRTRGKFPPNFRGKTKFWAKFAPKKTKREFFFLGGLRARGKTSHFGHLKKADTLPYFPQP